MKVRNLVVAGAVALTAIGITSVNPAGATDAGYTQISPTCELPDAEVWQAQWVLDSYSQPTLDEMLAVVCDDFGGVATDPTFPNLEYPGNDNGVGTVPNQNFPCPDPGYPCERPGG